MKTYLLGVWFKTTVGQTCQGLPEVRNLHGLAFGPVPAPELGGDVSAWPESPGPAHRGLRVWPREVRAQAHGLPSGHRRDARCWAGLASCRRRGAYDPERTELPGKSLKELETTSRLGSGCHTTESLLPVERGGRSRARQTGVPQRPCFWLKWYFLNQESSLRSPLTVVTGTSSHRVHRQQGDGHWIPGGPVSQRVNLRHR